MEKLIRLGAKELKTLNAIQDQMEGLKAGNFGNDLRFKTVSDVSNLSDQDIVALAKKLTLYSGLSIFTCNSDIRQGYISYSASDYVRVEDDGEVIEKATSIAPLVENQIAVVVPRKYTVWGDDSASNYEGYSSDIEMPEWVGLFPTFLSEGSLVKSSPSYRKLLFGNISLPYFQDIPLDLLVKLRNQETDAFIRFQYNIEEIYNQLNEANSETQITHLFRKTDYEVRKMEDEFKKLRNLRSVQVFNVGLFAASIVTLLLGQSELVGILSGMLGSFTLGSAMQQRLEYVQQMQDFKNKDFYFAWRIKQLSSRQ